MNSENEAMIIKETFAKEFDMAIDFIAKKYVRHTKYKPDIDLSIKIARLCVGTELIKKLKEIEMDAYSMNTLEFYKEHGNALPILEYSDFTASQIDGIISESPLSDRDKKIAYKMFVERKSQSEIYAEMNEIGDKKTISNNSPDISDILKHTASLMYK